MIVPIYSHLCFFYFLLSDHELLSVDSVIFIFNSPKGPEVYALLIVDQQIAVEWEKMAICRRKGISQRGGTDEPIRRVIQEMQIFKIYK